jgi:hypothetical protein
MQGGLAPYTIDAPVGTASGDTITQPTAPSDPPSATTAASAVDPSGLNPPAPRPTQKGPHGIRYDFNRGVRVELPPRKWRIQFRDILADCIVYNVEAEVPLGEAKCWPSSKRYYVPFELTVW